MSKDAIFISKKNRRFASGKRAARLPREREVFQNINNRLDLSLPPMPFRNCMITFVLALGTLGLTMGVLVWGASVIELVAILGRWEQNHDQIPMILVSLGMGAILIVGLGYTYILQGYLMIIYSRYVHVLYKQLCQEGVVIYGKVLSQESAENMKTRINYHFTLTETNEAIEGVYYTSTRQRFSSGDKVAVLYLNRQTHILL